MRETVSIEVDSTKQDMGVAAAIEAFRDVFERPNGRQDIANLMTELTGNRTRYNRQMIEKWFRPSPRMLPSSRSLVTLLWACNLLKSKKKNNRRQRKHE